MIIPELYWKLMKGSSPIISMQTLLGYVHFVLFQVKDTNHYSTLVLIIRTYTYIVIIIKFRVV